MKRFLVLLILIALLVPASGLAEYSPDLGMTMNEFIQKYNAHGSSLSSPLIALKIPSYWDKVDGANVAFFTVTNGTDVYIGLSSYDPGKTRDLSGGLDYLLVGCQNPKEFLAFVTVGIKCTEVFAEDFYTGYSMAPYYVSSVMKYYYENRSSDENYVAFQPIDSVSNRNLIFTSANGNYMFGIGVEGGNMQ